MARREIVTLTDDLDGSEGAQTVTFSLEGTTWQVDLGERNREALKNALKPFVDAAREVASGPDRPAAPRPARTDLGEAPDHSPDLAGWASARRVSVPARGESRARLIRAWAAEQGNPLPSRGRIPREVVAAYDASTRG